MVAHAHAIRKRGPKCWTCSLPPDLLASIHKARAKGAELPSIIDYMVSRLGYQQKDAAKLKWHFGSRHNVR